MEFLESDLIRNINQDGNQQSPIERKTMENSHDDDAIVIDDESSVGGDEEVHDEQI